MTPDDLVRHFDGIYRERMWGLPIVNADLAVEAVGFEPFEIHELGVLITPWFMNLVLLPGDDTLRDRKQGASCSIELPAGPYDFNVSHDDKLGTFLSAILFRTVSDFPDQATARSIAVEIAELVRLPEAQQGGQQRLTKPLSRRKFFSQLGAS